MKICTSVFIFLLPALQAFPVFPSITQQTSRIEMGSLLIPSQALRQTSHDSLASSESEVESSILLMPSQIVRVLDPKSNTTTVGKAYKRKKNRNKSKKKGGAKGSRSRPTASQKSKPRRHGNIPDIEWRAIPMTHLRQHPNFVPLPLPETIENLDNLEDVRKFRQESWQWDAVHEGRCTTSQAVAALGFLEPDAGLILGVPRSWQRGAVGAYHRLRKPALRSLEELNAVLCAGANGTKHEDKEFPIKNKLVWKQFPDTTNPFPFAAKYMVPIDENDRQERKEHFKLRYSNIPGFDFSVRMMWGNTQEATALLTGLNYFSSQNDGVENIQLKEVGMCGAGIQIDDSNLLLGATPDGLIVHSDGRTEVLEVKNHCPFLPSRNRNNNNNRPQSRFNIRPCDFGKNVGVLPHYLPQLMLEMMCVGPECQSAIMIRQSATSGALIMRINRDDGWIEEMLYWLKRFHADFVDQEVSPPPNFFLKNNNDEDKIARYKRFLDWTKELESKVDVLEHVPHFKIQRAIGTTAGTITDLFLD